MCAASRGLAGLAAFPFRAATVRRRRLRIIGVYLAVGLAEHCLVVFPQMALGLSGFEMILTVVPQVSGGMGQKDDSTAGRVRNMRKLMLTAATIMAIYLLSAVLVTTLFVPRAELGTDGTAEHRAIAYLAHGSPLVDGAGGAR